MIKVAVIGATGYVGIELIRLLSLHPEVMLTHAGTESSAGEAIAAIYPHLKGLVSISGQRNDSDTLAAHCDVVFCALPQGHAMKMAQDLCSKNIKLIDLSADFRLKDPTLFAEWYHQAHLAPELLTEAVYGLAECGYREAIKNAQLIANPGCYPTACALAALPLLKAKIVKADSCIFDAKSGLSGAGKNPQALSHFCEVAQNFSAYKVGGQHRHIPEIEQLLSQAASETIKIQFTPHLIPITRGMMVTAYFKLKEPMPTEDIAEIYTQAYANEPFIRLHFGGEMPQIKQVIGSNFCDIGFAVDSRTQSLVVISVVDNLIKGAAGQAIQNMNLMCGLTETLGLNSQFPIYP